MELSETRENSLTAAKQRSLIERNRFVGKGLAIVHNRRSAYLRDNVSFLPGNDGCEQRKTYTIDAALWGIYKPSCLLVPILLAAIRYDSSL